MEIHSSPESIATSHYYSIVQRLLRLGIPVDNLNQGQHGLVAFARNNRSLIGELVSAILPLDADEADEDVFHESMVWLQWLMFEKEPEAALEHLSSISANERGVCGDVWGNNDIAYRCRTCEHDPTCAICVPCFENGNHKDHDYSVIFTGGGCCDCGDITAWKREGFCSKHKGAEQVQPLPKPVAESLGPVLDFLLSYWKDRLYFAERAFEESPSLIGHAAELKAADALTSAVVKMLLDFCKQSESLLSFISERMYSSSGLLDILLRAEVFLSDSVVKLHELLLKMLGEPIFKYEFAKVFVIYYPSVVNAARSEGSDSAFKKYQLLSTFSVQILTVPTLTPRLVEEMDLLGVLLQCLEDIFSFCVGGDGRLQVVKWANLYETTLRVVGDIRFVMSHSAVPKYLCGRRRDLVRQWMRLLASMQGMNTLKRETGNHVEEENENVQLPFVLCHSISNILSLLVAGAFSLSSNDDSSQETCFSTYKLDCEGQDSLRHAKVGRLSEESSVSSMTGKSTLDPEAKPADRLPISSSVLWLIHECLRSMERWLGLDNALRALSLKTSLEFGQPTGYEPGYDDNNLDGERTHDLEVLRLLSSSDWPDIMYDVSSQEISVHIPLHRLLSMVLRRALKEYYGESGILYGLNASSVHSPFSRYHDFFGQILDGCHPNGFSAFVMEHPLRIRVFCAEVRAGMWRRNGDAPILFSEWYRSVRWSEQGQELDLFLLQCCATLAPPDLYVQRILERFGLSNYLSLNLKQSSEQEPVLVAEMLTLLIQIVKERRFCGLSTAECLQRELVYKLTIGDATRSQLVKSLPCDLSKVDELQEVLDRVAEYSHPSGVTQGMYKLRSSFWKELDLYHPCCNSRDLQAAEERYLRFCNVSALTTQLPKWTKIYYPLRGIAKIATCKTLLQILRAVLFYAVFSDKITTSRAPDGVLLTALHLLALALDVCQVHKELGDPYLGNVIPILEFASEEICMSEYGDQSMLSLLVLLMRIHEKENAQNFMEAGNFSLSSLVPNLINMFVELEPRCMTKLQKLAPQLADQFSNSILNANAKGMESVSDSEKRKAKARERQAAILEKIRAQQSKFLESFNSNGDDEMEDTKSKEGACDPEVNNNTQESSQAICSLCHDAKSKSPVSFLVLLQKSRLLSFLDQGPPSWEQVSGSGKEHIFNNGTTDHDLSPSSVSDVSEAISSSELVDSFQSAVDDFASMGQPGEVKAFMEFIKARFPSIKNIQPPYISKDTREGTASPLQTLEERMYMCIRDFKSVSQRSDSQTNNGSFSTAQNSKERTCSSGTLLLGKYIAALPKNLLDNTSESQNSRFSSDRMPSTPSTGHYNFGPSAGDGIYVSSCGHAVHQGCLDRYLSSVRERYVRRIVFEGRHIVDPDQGEFLCPVCRGLANSVLPTLPGALGKVPRSPVASAISFMDANSLSTSSDTVGSLHVQYALTLLERAAYIAGSKETLEALPTQHVGIEPSLEPIIRLSCGMYYPGQEKIVETGRISHSLILWDTLKYSLMSADIAARSGKSSLSPNYSIGALYKELNSSSGFILSLLLDVSKNTRTNSSPTILLRLRGIQLLARSLCPSSSANEMNNYNCQQGGKLLYVLENVEPKLTYPDIQLWREVSEPVLAHDAFSSFMWILFCLPSPILSCRESFLSLVHVFYVVSLTQAIVTYCKKRHTVETEMGLHDDLITDIYRAMEKYRESVLCFDAYYLNPAYDINDSIRSLTFPYLRRCALFWKLVNRSSLMPFNDGANPLGGYPYAADDLGPASTTVEELHEVEKLEKMFKIPPLDVIVNDENTRLTAMRWLSHLSELSEAHKLQRVLRCNPAVPFRLMVLPHLYQDLLQRYIKRCCPDCGVVKDERALCLLCGKLCSPNWKTCCRESSCQTHATSCGAGIGVFLLIRKTTILLQRSARQAPWPSPYLDAFGEEDVDMSRGKPLYLNEERYAALTHMVASHGLDRSSKVLRQTTVGAFFMF